MSKTNKGLYFLSIPLLTLLLLFAGCDENPGSVGNDYVDNPELTFDTLDVASMEVVSYNGYSGRLAFVPMGYYSDPVFGDVEAIGMVKPIRRPSFNADSIELGNFSMQLEFNLDSLNTYGDTLSQSSFTLYPITSDWRGTIHRINSELAYDQNRPVASFTIGDSDSIVVEELSQDWVDEYKVYFNDSSLDSAYKYEFKGLAVVPDNQSSKISFALPGSSRFKIINEAETDTVYAGFTDWAYSLNRSGENIPSGTSPLHTTLEGMFKIVMDTNAIKSRLQGRNLVRAEFVLTEAGEEISSSLPDSSHNRLAISALNLDFEEEVDPVYEYQFGGIELRAMTRADENSNIFRSNMDSYINNRVSGTYINNVVYGNESRAELMVGIGSSSGALRSTLIYNNDADSSLRPKLILTSLADE